ncbi:MAG: hypothetical protein ABSF97_17420 [Candidatus Sulfotelmatobacter sp.]|jgi:hypothetical protein
MPKRHLRVLQWIGAAPVIAVCTQCNQEFKVPVAALKRVAEAQQNLTVQFAEHKCEDQ